MNVCKTSEHKVQTTSAWRTDIEVHEVFLGRLPHVSKTSSTDQDVGQTTSSCAECIVAGLYVAETRQVVTGKWMVNNEISMERGGRIADGSRRLPCSHGPGIQLPGASWKHCEQSRKTNILLGVASVYLSRPYVAAPMPCVTLDHVSGYSFVVTSVHLARQRTAR